nr:ribonuclease H-like domain-containing protein [Tanacetum cinerariifolium]
MKKAQHLEPKLYDGNFIKSTSAIVIPDSEETLMLAEESRSKMILKQHDPMVLEKRVNNKPVDYDVLNQLSQDFEKRFVSKTELSAEQAFYKDIVNIVVNSFVDNASMNMHECKKCLKLETELLNKKDFIEKETYDKLFRSYTTLKKHCISLEVDTQLNQEIFQRDNSVLDQSAPSFDQYFKLNELKAQSQEKDTIKSKLRERIKSLSGNMNKDKVKKDIDETKTINIELDHKVSKLIAKNEHLKQTYKQLYDSIKPIHVRSKEQCDALINQVNQKSVEISDLNANLQEKGLIITALRDELKKLKRKALVDNHSKLNENSKLICVKCNGCMLSDNHDLCVLNVINDVNARSNSKSVKKTLKRKVWKPTGKVFTKIGYTWRLTGQIFTIVGNACPLTRITTTAKVPLRKLTALETDTPKPVVTLVYSRKPRKSKTNVLVSKPKIIKSISANNKEPTRHGLVQGLPKLKFKKVHLCSTCAMDKFPKKTHKPKPEDTNQEKLYLSHMDLCGPMRVVSVNGKKYILVIIDDYSRLTWVKCLSVDLSALKVIVLIAEVVAPEPAVSTGLPSSTTVDQDVPSSSNSQTLPKTQSQFISTMLKKRIMT